jgi:hypothetical protein
MSGECAGECDVGKHVGDAATAAWNRPGDRE